MMKSITLFFSLYIYSTLTAQVLDFENLHEVKVGDEVSNFNIGDQCEIEFFTGHNLIEKSPFYLQRIGARSTAGFQGIKSSTDCEGKSIPENRFNNMNSNGYKLNPSYSNKDRVGCQFISATLEGNNMPSVFIHYNIGTKNCSGDILDVDGANNAIEAYDIFYYKRLIDYPNHPVNTEPLKIRTSGSSFGNGEIGDDGGIEHFSISESELFVLVEIRPNQQPNEKNKTRTIFGFALDNFSPCLAEKPPFTPPYLINQQSSMPQIEDVYFDFDKFDIKSSEQKKLDLLIKTWKEDNLKNIVLTAFTDPKGSNDYNMKLSKKRVEIVKTYLLNNGISESSIQTICKGEMYQGSPNDPDWKKRKVGIKLN